MQNWFFWDSTMVYIAARIFSSHSSQSSDINKPRHRHLRIWASDLKSCLEVRVRREVVPQLSRSFQKNAYLFIWCFTLDYVGTVNFPWHRDYPEDVLRRHTPFAAHRVCVLLCVTAITHRVLFLSIVYISTNTSMLLLLCWLWGRLIGCKVTGLLMLR